MGLFSVNYDKNGPGVSKNAPQKKRFFLFFEIYFRKFKYILGLNVLYLALCIPIITIGPATAAITHVYKSFTREEPIFIWSEFWRIFKENFKYGALLGIIELAVKGILGYSIYFYLVNLDGSTFVWVPFILCITALFMVSFTGYYAYMLLITVNLSFKGIIKNAFMLGMISTKSSIITAVSSIVIMGALILMIPYTLPVMVVFGVSTVLFIQCFNAYPTIKKYCIDPIEEQKREEEARRRALNGEDELDEVIFTDTVGVEEEE